MRRYWLAWLVLSSFIIGVIAVIILSIWPYETLYIKEPITVKTKVLTTESAVILNIDYCNYRLSDKLVFSIVDNATLRAYELYSSSGTALKKGFVKGCKVRDIPVPLSLLASNLPNGTYYYQFDLDFDVNPLKTIHKTFKTEVFELRR